MDVVLIVLVCLALWWSFISLLMLRDRARDTKAPLTPEEEEEARKLDADIRARLPEHSFFSKETFHDYVRAARKNPSTIIGGPIVFSIYAAILFLGWPAFVILRRPSNRQS